MRQLPNIITCTRIILSFALLLLSRQPSAFVMVYFCCGITDVADGFVARRIKAETTIGAKLDSFADFIFFAAALFVFLTTIRIENVLLILTVITAIATIRIINFIITKQKFHQWGVLHTIANKVTGVALFLSIPLCIWLNHIPLWLIISTGAIAAISAVEESAILIAAKDYDANRKSFFI